MSYKLEFNGVTTHEFDKVLRSIEKQVNGFGIHAQTSDPGTSSATSGSASSTCPPGQDCTNSVKGGHDYLIVLIAIVAGAVAGAVAGTTSAKRVLGNSVKGGHD